MVKKKSFLEKLVSDNFFIISSWDWENELKPNWNRLFKTVKKFQIYHQGDIKNLSNAHIDTNLITKTKHTGSNISDYLLFILKNYPYFPEYIGFIKANLIERHIPENKFISLAKKKDLVPLYFERKTLKKKSSLFRGFIFQQIAPGICLEITNNWYIKNTEKGKYFPLIEDLYYFITKQKIIPKFIPMIPGANFITKSEKILRWDKSFFEKLYEAASYQSVPNPMPVEAWHIERCLMYIFFFERYNV